MELREAHSPNQFGPASEGRKQPAIPSKIRVAALIDRLDVRVVLQEALISAHVTLQEFDSHDSIGQAIYEKTCDVAIIDVEQSDLWPSLFFNRIDEIASCFPVIVLCKSKQDMLSYRLKANYVSDIFTYETLHDTRFSSVIEAVRLRIETAQPAENAGSSDRLHWRASEAALQAKAPSSGSR